MWKDFFYFSKRERRAIIVLTLLIIIIQSIIWTSDLWLSFLPESIRKISGIQKDMNAFQDSLSDSHQRNVPEYESSGFLETSRQFSTTAGNLSVFNPNTADSAAFISLGLSPYVARNILKYRRMGGVFRKVEDFGKIYGIQHEQYIRLKPYIQIPLQKNDFLRERILPDFENSQIGNNQSPSRTEDMTIGSTTSQHIEINRIDTTTLLQVKGIGSVTAGRINKYRNRLGGFYSIKQLEDIKGIYPDVLIRLQSILKVDTSLIVKINVNKASLEKLRAHPYLSFYQAKVIVELRKARSGIRNLNELLEIKEFSAIDLERLKWYLSF
jgi:DNA uptake protein ComE-like DNA-binding protein